ncbi:MAG TPA: diguanylate cyclase [bacterium]|nr:diguanylate cyclase [bacterium]
MERSRRHKIVLYGQPDSYQEGLNHLSDQGHNVVVLQDINEVKRHIYAEMSDVLLLDLPHLGDVGLTLCRRLKSDPRTYNKPIIVAFGRQHDSLELAAIQADVDDFTMLPMAPTVLAARIQMIINRSSRQQMSNPLTGLPGNLAIEEHLNRKLSLGQPLAVAYADLDNFKAFNDRYGYSRGDNVIRLTAMIVKEAIQNYGRQDDFYGHIGGDDFIMITDWACLDQVCTHAITSFDTLVPFQYDEEDRVRGGVFATNRQGESVTIPVMTLSIGVVTNQKRELRNCLQIADLATEMKSHAKQFSRSLYLVDRRQEGVRMPETQSTEAQEPIADLEQES